MRTHAQLGTPSAVLGQVCGSGACGLRHVACTSPNPMNPRTLLLFVLSMALAAAPLAQAAENPPATGATEIRLWAGDAPGALGQARGDIPTLTAYLPEPTKRNGTSIVIFPGGSYAGLADHEGRGYAEWFASNGICAYVLKYRLGTAGYRHPVMLNDAARAVRMVRSFARRDGLDATRIGVIGSSAGGHLASTIVTHFEAGKSDATDPIERESSRPDLAVLCYPVITLGEFTHAGSKKNLLGETPAPDLVQLLSNETQVTKDTPPCFIWHTVEDKTVPVENAIMFASALRRAGVPFSLHIYQNGAHGLGLGRPGRPAPPWADQLLYWFGERAFLR
jgi:acetyl esterase/lipase